MDALIFRHFLRYIDQHGVSWQMLKQILMPFWAYKVHSTSPQSQAGMTQGIATSPLPEGWWMRLSFVSHSIMPKRGSDKSTAETLVCSWRVFASLLISSWNCFRLSGGHKESSNLVLWSFSIVLNGWVTAPFPLLDNTQTVQWHLDTILVGALEIPWIDTAMIIQP